MIENIRLNGTFPKRNVVGSLLRQTTNVASRTLNTEHLS